MVGPFARLKDFVFLNVLILVLSFFVVRDTYSQENKREVPEYQSKELKREKQPDWFSGVVELPVIDSAYIVGPNDFLTIAIFGTRFFLYEVQVSSDGSILVPYLGEIFVKDKSLREVRALIKLLVSQNFKSAGVTVNLARARIIKVTLAGAVRKPGIMYLSATSRVSEAIEEAGGFITDTSSHRNILLIRNAKDTMRVDILAYHRFGDTGANPFVIGGDIIYVPPRDRQVSIFGSVNYSGRIDFVEGEYLYDLIRLAQGFKEEAFLDSVQVVRFQPDHVSTKSFFFNLKNYPQDQSVNISLRPGDLVLVRAIPKYHFQHLVTIKGEVKYPGSYPIVKDKTTLTEIIHRVGSFTKDASLEEATVIRKQGANEIDREFERLKNMLASDMRQDEYEYFKARSRERQGQMVVNFKKLFLENDLREDIILREDDVIEIPELKNYIRLIGRVINAGNVIYNPKWNYENYIAYAGGYGWRADDGDVRIIKVRTGEIVDAEKKNEYILEPGDAIWVPEVPEVKFWNIFLTTLSVVSQIAGVVGIVIALSALRK